MEKRSALDDVRIKNTELIERKRGMNIQQLHSRLLTIILGLLILICMSPATVLAAVPSAPANLTATAISTSQIDLSWNYVSDATNYYIYRSSMYNGSYALTGTSASPGYVDNGLASNTTYYYKIQAYNSSGLGSFSSVVYTTTNSSSLSAGLTAAATGTSQIYLSWPSDSSVAYYRISRSTSYSGIYSLLTMSNSNYYTDNNVSPGITLNSSIASSMPSGGSSQIPSERLAGANRYETSKDICASGWNTSYYAVVVSGENYPDALCSSPLAAKYNAPILLTSKNSLDLQTKAELTRLNVKGVFLIGGLGVISADTEQAIKNMGITVSRIAGSDRYETSLKIAQTIGQASQVVITGGDNFPDVLSMAPITALNGIPILLTPNNTLSNNLKLYLQNSVKKTYILGGTNVISDGIMSLLPSPQRLNAANRYENNVNIINTFADELDFSTCYLATGESYPDALSGSVLAALTKSPLILVNSPIDPSTLNFIRDKKNAIKKMVVFGGTGVVPDSVLTF
ncbi:MAG: N-acetylmuramoyl-L-alanine amidase LytC [Candidatus Dichloromethanomonas elyunquensis]|nr:MAG: N-acetylmuramoyl-L-alanine amidase LytC [Candidatus Dichloromethanomonas elyunquensis]